MTETTTVGVAGSGAFTHSGGTHATTTLNLGTTATTGSGSYALSGTGQLSTTNTYIGRSGLGVFTQTGGTHTVAQGLFVGLDGGTATYTLSGGTVDAGETYVVGNPAVFNLNAGTLRTGGVTLGPNPTFNFNGGTLQAKRDNAEFVRFPGNVFVRAGGAVIDSNGHTVGIRSILLHDTALGNTPDGGLTKTGAGTLILTGAGYSGQTTGNTYTGATTVNAGTLLVNNTHGSGTGSGNVTVNAGGQLGGTGAISGAVSIANGGTLAPGTSIGTLRTGSLSLASGGTFLFELDGANGTADRVDVTGAVNLGGGNLVLSLLSAATLGQTFDLLHNDGSDINIGFFASGSTVTGTFNGGTYVFAINYTANNDGGAFGNDISLVTVAVPEPSTWAFALSGLGLLGGYQYFAATGAPHSRTTPSGGIESDDAARVKHLRYVAVLRAKRLPSRSARSCFRRERRRPWDVGERPHVSGPRGWPEWPNASGVERVVLHLEPELSQLPRLRSAGVQLCAGSPRRHDRSRRN
jgi:hypothetical protein